MKQETREWLSKQYGIDPESISWYNSGICYSRIIVFDEETANKIAKQVEMFTVNGGMLHGMPLGYIHSYKDENGVQVFDVMI